ncbi:hypothetical protein A6F68_01652 [Tsuneonella dongtanensis]|uniref:Uncharacterized protein n=1 Tax=Tsuneonella dongtanensis TaxID=692370 RepID=A0A1B2ADP2_9SPHN|nr:hypothetical protein [Tsuneonella dongtanensis]ANY20165.1 hypothetical protein A6F68_01652 [Tsuneonella dongtanensis]
MEKRGDEVHASETEVSGGSKEGVVRWVLIIGLILAVGFLTIIWVTGAAVQDDGADSETSVSNTIAVEEAADEDRGEPIAPAMDGPEEAADTGEEPGDAPAGDPKPDAN